MQSILDAINEWIKEILIGAINGNLSTMFGDVNEKVGTIAAEVGQTPQGWNANIFSMIQTLSENVIVPIAGLVITYVLCYELISMVTEKNNMHDVDTSMFFKWVFKAFVAVYLVTHTFDITMAVFDMAQHVVSGAAGVIGGSTEIDVAAALASMQSGLDAMEIPELLLLVMETSLVSLCMKIMSVLITVILYGRMIEIDLFNHYMDQFTPILDSRSTPFQMQMCMLGQTITNKKQFEHFIWRHVSKKINTFIEHGIKFYFMVEGAAGPLLDFLDYIPEGLCALHVEKDCIDDRSESSRR